jgi:hypothetical protein
MSLVLVLAACSSPSDPGGGGAPAEPSTPEVTGCGTWEGDREVYDRESLRAASSDAEILGNLQIDGPELASLGGLSCLTTVRGAVDIERADTLVDLLGLEGLTSAGSLEVGDNGEECGGCDGNDHLASLDGLDGLVSVEAWLSIQYNPALTEIDALSGLGPIAGTVTVLGNASLANLDGLAGVTSIGGTLYVGANDALSDIAGLDGLEEVGALYFEHNPRLPTCAVTRLVDRLRAGGWTGEAVVAGNDDLASCDPG